MAITSIDIQTQSFSIDRKGYDVDEVDEFLERVASEIDILNATVAELQGALADAADAVAQSAEFEIPAPDYSAYEARIAELEDELERANSDAAVISQALIVAQRSADGVVAKANADAEAIIANANEQAENILQAAKEQRQSIYDAIDALEDERDAVRDNYQAMLNDFITDAQAKLGILASEARTFASSAHARPAAAETTGRVAPIVEPIAAEPAEAPASVVEPVATSYVTPQTSGEVFVAQTPVATPIEKDMSGFGDADDDWDYDVD